ncbi:MAG: signal peptidase II [Rhodococcus sp.]|nr:signal peptidase II [Rhodococcus sp. (in: high G+C Gram-positive bacteria)]
MDDGQVSHDPTPDPEVSPPDQTSLHDDSDAAPVKAQSPRRHRMRLLLGIAVAILVFDLVTKIAAVAFIQPGSPIWLIGDVVSLRLVRNPGAAFSMATSMTWLLTIVAIAVVIGVVKIGRTLQSSWWAWGLGLILGGALGNLVDRFFRSPGVMRGHVVDFVSVGWWPVFNVADSAIVCGAVLLVALTLFGVEPEGKKKDDQEEPAQGKTAQSESAHGESKQGEPREGESQ